MAMDVPRGKEVARRKLIRRIVYIALLVAAIPLITWGLSRLKPAAPSVDRATVWIDTVKRGPMVRDVRGLGTLVVEQYMWIPAEFESRVDKINFLPGATVHPNDVIMVLSEPDMELAAADLQWQIKAAQANLENLRVTLESQQLAQKATTEQVKSDMEQAQLQSDRDSQLTKLGLKSDLDTKLSVAKSEELKGRYALSKEQLDISDKSIQAQMDAQRVQIEKLEAAYKLKKEQVEQLTIRSATDGTLTQLGTTATPLEVGMRVAPGTILAKIAQPNKLKATLKIPETQVKDVAIGQAASIDTRNGIIPGHVSRIDPAAVNGTVDVDVARGRAAARSAAGFERGWNHHAGEVDRRGVRGPAGGWAAGREDHAVQAGCRQQRGAARSGFVGAQFGEQYRSGGRAEGRGSGDLVGYVGAGRVQPNSAQLNRDRKGAWGRGSWRLTKQL
jgi:HlyD family secretion protein